MLNWLTLWVSVSVTTLIAAVVAKWYLARKPGKADSLWRLTLVAITCCTLAVLAKPLLPTKTLYVLPREDSVEPLAFVASDPPLAPLEASSIVEAPQSASSRGTATIKHLESRTNTTVNRQQSHSEFATDKAVRHQ
ncbi:MAG: hypothetical protein AAFV88_24580, partial [Planctomycetota bacterium]